jgi:2-oxoglutarate ferredoxin oxidoreductase subunit delta
MSLLPWRKHRLAQHWEAVMAKGEIVIIESNCFGCGYCEKFCLRGGIAMTGDKFSATGYPLPSFVNPEKCNACGNCAAMCPHFAIEVYKYVAAA